MVRVKVRYHTCFYEYDYGIYAGGECILVPPGQSSFWKTEAAAIRNANAMAKKIGIKYDPEVIKQHGC